MILKKKSLSLVLVLVLVMLVAFAASPVIAGQGPVSVPGGPYLHPDAEVGRQSILTTEEVEAELFRLESQSGGKMEVRVVGYSGADNQPLYAAVIGDGPKRIWIQGRIHGNEPYGAEACLDVLRTLVGGGSKAQAVLAEMTFMVIPNYNPDGFDRYQRQEGKHHIDLNRDWNISYEDWLRTRELVQDGEGFMAFPWDWFTRFKAVESESFFDAWYDFKPHYAIDIHHQGTYYVDDTDEMTAFTIGIPVNPAHLRDEIWDTSRQMAVVTYDATDARGYCNPTRYPYIDLPSACISSMMVGGPGPGYPGPTWEAEYLDCVMALGGADYVFNGYEAPDPAVCDDFDCITEIPGPTEWHAEQDGFILDPEWDTAAIFFENRGGIQQLSRGYLIQQNILGLWAVIDAVVTGELADADPDRWDEIPPRGSGISGWPYAYPDAEVGF